MSVKDMRFAAVAVTAASFAAGIYFVCRSTSPHHPQHADTKTTSRILDMDMKHPLEPFWEQAAASTKADALRVSLELGLFDALTTPLSATGLAGERGLYARNTGCLLDLLWSIGLLDRYIGLCPDQGVGEPLYHATEVAQRYFTKASPQYCGEAWLYRLQAAREFGATLVDALRDRGGRIWPRGPEHDGAAHPGGPADIQIAQEQRAISARAALELLRRVPGFAEIRNFCDVGGAPGFIAMEIVRAHETRRGVIFDLPEPAARARLNVEQAHLSSRLEVLSGDLASDEIGSGYDLIWCSSVLHFIPDLHEALRKIRQAAVRGGIFVCVHAEIPHASNAASRVLPNYTPLRMGGHRLTREGELEAAMRAAGFRNIVRMSAGGFPMAPMYALVGRA